MRMAFSVSSLLLIRAAIFGMNQAAAKDAISSTCRSLLIRAETRKTFRGAVSHPTVTATFPTTFLTAAPLDEYKGKRKQDQIESDDIPAKKSRTASLDHKHPTYGKI